MSRESKKEHPPLKKNAQEERKRPDPQPRQSSLSTEAEQTDGALRLNVFLQRRGVASRRKADEMIEQGLVRINRKVVTALGTRVTPGDTVSVSGRVLKAEIPSVTYLLHKPDLTLTTRKDNRSRRTIFDLPSLSKIPSNVQPVGRLDFRSEGLLILTNDGELALALSHPKYHVDKTYAVLVSEQFMPDDLERLRNGVELADGFAKPLSVKLGGSEKLGGSRGQWLKVVVSEGRHRLVRRMLAAIGFKVVRLVRIGVGTIELPDNLAPGDIIPASSHVLALLDKYRSRILRPNGLSPEKVATKKTNKNYPSGPEKRPYALKKQSESMELAQNRKQRRNRQGTTSAPRTKSPSHT